MRSVLDAKAALAKGFSLASFSHSLKCSCNRAGELMPLCQGTSKDLGRNPVRMSPGPC